VVLGAPNVPIAQSVLTAQKDQGAPSVLTGLSVEIVLTAQIGLIVLVGMAKGLTGGNPVVANEPDALAKTARAGLVVHEIVTSELPSMRHPVMMIRLLTRMRYRVSLTGLRGENSKL
jgi:hypothetical protein